MKRFSSLVVLLVAFPSISCAVQNKSAAMLMEPASLPGTATTSRQIIIISDLHLGEGKDAETGRWYPMEDFRWPLQFSQFIEQVTRDGNGRTDLIVNGDLFELWQSREKDCQVGRGKDFGCTEEEALGRLNRVIGSHESELKALGEFARKGDNRLVILPGNHDAALLFPKVKDATLKAINGGTQVSFLPKGYWISKDGLVYVEHGHQIGRDVNKWNNWPSPFLDKDGKRYLQRPWGEIFVQDYYNRFEIQYPIIDNFTSEREGVSYGMAAEGQTQTIQDVNGFLKFYFFGVSWSQFNASLGKEKEGSPPEWDIEAIKKQGLQFLAESLPSDHPLYPKVREPGSDRETQKLEELLKNLTDEDIKIICDQRAFLSAKNQEDNVSPTISNCPQYTGDLGALAQSIFRTGEKVLGEHLEKVVCPSLPGCDKSPFMVFIYGHTHQVVLPHDLSLSNGNWNPTIVNSGAWQRVVTSEQMQSMRVARDVPKMEVLFSLIPEDLPPCYSYVLIKPYSKAKGELPTPRLRYWIGEEGKEGKASEICN